MKRKDLKIKQAAILFLILLPMFAASFKVHPGYAYSINANRQELFTVQKKSLQDEAIEIEKAFGVKVLQEDDGLYCEIKSGNYRNDRYGFSVVVPQGLRGLTDVPPHPHHGFFIHLAQETEARIWINAAYNSAVYETLCEVVDAEIKSLEFAFRDFELRKRKSIRLQGIPAAHLFAQYRSKVSGELMISEQIIALNKAGEEDLGIIYCLSLETPESRYQTDRKIFRQIFNSWRLVSETLETENEIDR